MNRLLPMWDGRKSRVNKLSTTSYEFFSTDRMCRYSNKLFYFGADPHRDQNPGIFDGIPTNAVYRQLQDLRSTPFILTTIMTSYSLQYCSSLLLYFFTVSVFFIAMLCPRRAPANDRGSATLMPAEVITRTAACLLPERVTFHV